MMNSMIWKQPTMKNLRAERSINYTATITQIMGRRGVDQPHIQARHLTKSVALMQRVVRWRGFKNLSVYIKNWKY